MREVVPGILDHLQDRIVGIGKSVVAQRREQRGEIRAKLRHVRLEHQRLDLADCQERLGSAQHAVEALLRLSAERADLGGGLVPPIITGKIVHRGGMVPALAEAARTGHGFSR